LGGCSERGHGVPVVVSDVGALAELAPDRSLVVPPGDSRRLAAALLAHLDDDGAARQKILSHAKRHFAWPVIAARSLELYAAVLAEQGRAA
jgi:glycosyltransferase involved in cell wall biosynthesis